VSDKGTLADLKIKSCWGKFGATIQMQNCESVLLMECGSPQIKRNGIAITYRLAMEADRDGRENINWEKVNTAIIARWSKSGLRYIKERAWRWCPMTQPHTQQGGERR
jgi:hypothetical protein